MAIGILVGVLVFALALAVWGLSRVPPLPGLTSSDGETFATAAESAGATDTPEGTEPGTSAPETPAGSAGAPLSITAAKDYDPLGDGAENSDRLAQILDGDSETWWGSEGYQTSAFSGLKSGLGVVLDLRESSTISEVTLQLPGSTSGTLYATDDAAYFDSGKALGDDLTEAGSFSGEGSVTTPVADGTSGRYVIVWFTEISRDGDWYRARLAGVSATS